MSGSNEKVVIFLCVGGSWRFEDGVYEYLPLGLKKRPLIIPKNITLSRLRNCVSKKVNPSKGFLLSYKYNSCEILDLLDDDDVFVFIQFVARMGDTPVTLYISEGNDVEVRRSHVSSNDVVSVTQSLNVATIGGDDYVPVSTAVPPVVNKVVRGFDLNTIYEPRHVVFEENLVTGETNDFSNYNQFSEKTTNDDQLLDSETLRYFGLSDQDEDVDPGIQRENDFVGDDNIRNDVDDVQNDDEGVDYNQIQKDHFWGMPSLMPTPTYVSNSKTPLCYEPTSHVKVDQRFKNKEELKLALGLKCIQEGYEIRVSKSTKDRYEAICCHENCEWRIRATAVRGCEAFTVRKFVDRHTCPKTLVHPNHRQANKKVLGHILKDSFADSSRVYRGKEIVQDMNSRFNVSITYKQAWRAKMYAVDLLRGSPEESFTVLPIYCHNLKKTNPGTVTHIDTDCNDCFVRFFVAIGSAIRTFVYNLRPLIIIDGAHLKGKYLGTMFLAVAMDGNNQIVPIAYGVGKTESFLDWEWFLMHLKECIGEIDNLVFISDRAASIAAAIRSVFPNAFHGICCRHLEANLKFIGRRAKDNKWVFWKTCKAYTIGEFECTLELLKSVLAPESVRILEDLDNSKWTRSHSTGMRYNVMTSNSAESFNALSRYARALPITMLIDFFRANLQQWFYERSQKGANLENELTPWAEDKINKRIAQSTSWMVYPISQYVFEVRDGSRNGIVNLQEWSCSCRKWQLSGLPCGHVIATMRMLGHSDCSQWVHACYRVNVYRNTYADAVYPVGPQCAWERPNDLMIVKPPVMDKRQAGRPRNRDRIPSQGEGPILKKCSRCKQRGHTRIACRAPLPSAMHNTGSSASRSTPGTRASQNTPYPTFDLND